MSDKIGGCWLCGETHKLHQSHIIPKFVFDWLKASGGTPYLRQGTAPNRRVQDGDKHLLYCQKCESTLSVFENAFKQKVFATTTKSGEMPKKYGPWLSRFAVSLSLRTIQSQSFRGISDQYPEKIRGNVDAATQTWRDFLLGKVSNPRQYRQYIFNGAYFDSYDADNLPPNWNTYIKRSVERDFLFFDDGSFGAALTKIGPILFVGLIRDDANYFGKDFIRTNESLHSRNQFSPPSLLFRHLLERGWSANEIRKKISDKQAAVSEKEVLRRLDQFAQSDLLKTMWDDYMQFGRN